MKDLSVLIVGGGIGGLTSAIALCKHGFAVEVVEIDPAWSVYGVGIIQQANTVRAVAALGILDEYLSASFSFEEVKLFAPNGAHLATIPSPRLAGADYPSSLGIARTALHKVLGDAAIAAGAKIRLGVSIRNFEQADGRVTAEFTDGSSGHFDLLIGADGLYSQIRAMLFPADSKPSFTGQAVWRYNFPRPPEIDCIHVHTGSNSVGLVPLSQTLMYMFVTSYEPGNPRIPKERLAAEMRDRLAGETGVMAVLRDQIIDNDQVVYRPLEKLFLYHDWFQGNVIVIGDAAHASTPHLGQGSGIAIEDSLVLAEELANQEDVQTAFRAFMSRRYERCRFVVEASAEIGEWQMADRHDVDHPGMVRRMYEVTAQPI